MNETSGDAVRILFKANKLCVELDLDAVLREVRT